MLSPVALENFYENVFLGLSDAQISLDDVDSLEKHFPTLRKNNPELNDYRINLRNIAVILDVPEQIITGRITEYPCRTWKRKLYGFHFSANG